MADKLEYFDVLNEYGDFTGKIATREECHEKGYWHRAVYGFIINNNGNILLQLRNRNKKLWPMKWDVTVGGHVLSGEFGRDALIRECKEELGINVSDDEIKFIVASTSKVKMSGVINNHYDECYLIKKDINIEDLKLQKEEVEEMKYFSPDKLLKMIENNYQDLTTKTSAWSFLTKILENKKYLKI